MFRRRILLGLLLLILAFGLFSLGGYVGWSQGFASGSLAATVAGDGGGGGGGGEMVAPRPFGGYYPAPFYGPGFYPFFFGFGLFFKFFFFLFFIFLISRFFGFWGWRMAGGPPGYWRGRRWGPYGPPPWWNKEDKAGQESPIPPEPGDRER